MTAKSLNQRLIHSFSELQQAYTDEIAWQEGDDTGSHVVFGDVLTPYLLKSIQDGRSDIIEKVCVFLEELLQTKDEYANEVVTCSVLESIVAADINHGYVEPMLGEKTNEIWQMLKKNV